MKKKIEEDTDKKKHDSIWNAVHEAEEEQVRETSGAV